MYDLGANEVIPEEFETSVEIFTRVLAKYLIPRNEIEALVTEIRSDGYEMFRSLVKESPSFSDLNLQLPDVEISTLRVVEGSPLIGKNLAEIELRKKYGVTLLAIRRNSQIISNPNGSIPFCSNDVLFLLGTPDRIARVADLTQKIKEEDEKL